MNVELCDAASLDNSGGEAKGRESYGGFLTLAFPVDAESGEVSFPPPLSMGRDIIAMFKEEVSITYNRAAGLIYIYASYESVEMLLLVFSSTGINRGIFIIRPSSSNVV